MSTLERFKKKKKGVTDDESVAPTPQTGTLDRYKAKSGKTSDIAPVTTTTTSKTTSKTTSNKEDDDRKWFEKGFFEDGYQFGDLGKTLLSTSQDITENMYAGIIGMGEKVVDAAAYAAGGIAGAFGSDSFKRNAQEFIAKDLYDEKAIAKKLVSWSSLTGIVDDLGVVDMYDTDKGSFLGEKLEGVVQSGGQLLGTAALQAVGVPWFVTSGVTSFGGEVESAFNEGATYGQAGASGLITAGAEILTEKISGGIKFGGATLDDAMTKKLATSISNKFVRNALKIGMDVVGEGAEEVLSEDIGRFGKWLTYQDEQTLAEMLWSEEAMDAKIEAFIGGAALGGVGSGSKAVAGIKGRDAVSNMTANEELVFKKVYDERIAEAEKDGKLSAKEKNKIYDEVMNDLEKGRISTDTIGEALGGATYETYKANADSEAKLREQAKALQDEYDTLNKMKRGDMTGEQVDRQGELRQQLTDVWAKIEDTQKKGEGYKKAWQEGAYNQAKGTRLAESYNEVARRGQAFEADVMSYDEKQRETIKKAVDSGFLNNTNRTHEFVDMIAKISADKGVSFDFLNNEKLKGSKYARDDAFVNGYYDKANKTIGVNLSSSKAWQATVGHEVTHVLEGTELYEKLQNALFEYSKSKGDYDSRREAVSKLYAEEDVDAELTADLVGDYLFTDEGFITNLSTKHRNVFQKIYDEIKYLLKIATAGSKEARDLERVKKAFEKAYKADTKASSDTKYSLSDSDGKQLSKGQQEYFKDSKVRDEDGNLKVMYHGSQDAGFHTFDPSMSDDDTSLFFVDRNDVAASYSGTTETYEAQTIRTAEDMNNFLAKIDYDHYKVVEKNGKFELLENNEHVAWSDTAQGIYEEFCWYEGVGEGDANYKVYLNLTNPLVVDAEGRNWNNISREFSQEVYDRYQSLTAEEKAALTSLTEWGEFGIFRDEIQEAVNVTDPNGDHNPLTTAYHKLADNELTGGEDEVDFYDLFSIASDNFSEDALKEFASKKMNTRDYAKKAKAEGYDGVIFRNIVDVGGYGNGSEGASTVAIAFDSNQIKSVANENPTGDADIRYSLSADSQGRELSPAVKNRFANSKVVDEDGNLKVVYHGTATGEFSIFDKAKGNVEGDFGSGFYFTDNEADVADHYEDGGPDFDNKVARLAERIESDEDIDYEEAEQRARAELYKGGYRFEVYLNIEKPATVGETMLFESDSYFSEYNQEDYDNEDDYYGDVEQLVADDIDGIIWDIENNVDVDTTDGIAEILWEAFNGGGIGIEELKKSIDNLYLEDSEGNFVSNEVTRQIIESLGYDGIIDPTVADKFKSMGIEHGTTHYIVFKPNQIKSVTNQSPTDNPDIHRSLSTKGEAPTKHGSYYTPLKDLAYDAPVQETVAPVDEAVTEAPVAEMPSEPSLQDLYTEKEALEAQIRKAYAENDTEHGVPLMEQYNELLRDIEQMEADETERFNSILDTDAPVETERDFVEMPDTTPLTTKAVSDISKSIGSLLGLGKKQAAELAEVVSEYSKAEGMSREQLYEEVKSKFGTVYVTEEDATLKEVKQHLRTTPIKVSDTIKADIAYTYGSYNDFRKQNFGKLRISNNGVDVDSEYMELSELYPSYFPEDIINPAEQFARISEIANESHAIERAMKVDDDTLLEATDSIINGVNEFRQGEIEKLAEASMREAQNSLLSSEDIAPVAEKYEAIRPKTSKEPRLKRVTAEDIAPTFETKKADQLNGQQTMFDEGSEDGGKTAEVLTEEPEASKKKKGFLQWFKTHFISKGNVFENLSLKKGNRALQEKYHAMKLAENKAQVYIKKHLKPLVDKAEATGKTKQLYEYAYHLHNIDRMSLESKAQEKIAGMQGKFDNLKPDQIRAIAAKEITDKTTEKTAQWIRDAKDYLNAMEAENKAVFGDSVTADVSREMVKKLEAENPEFAEMEKAIVEYNANLRQELVDGGVISQELADKLGEMYPHYVPIRRAGKGEVGVNVPLDTNKTGVNTPLKRATGGNSDILPLFDTMALRTQQTFRAIARNSFGLELMHTLDTEVGRGDADIDADIDAVMDSVDTDGELLKAGKNGMKPTFTVFEDGKRVEFEITEDMYEALKPTSEALRYKNKVLNKASQAFRKILTEYNLVFAAKNATRDFQDILTNSQHPAQTYKEFIPAIYEMARNGQYNQEFVENGGEMMSYFDSDAKTFTAEDKGLKKIVGLPLRAVSSLNNFIERAPRLAEYMASRKMGKSIEAAMLDAARVTTDFSDYGDISKFLNNNGATFLTASISGANQQIRNIKEAKANGLKGVLCLAGRFALAGIPALVLNHLLWDDDEEYAELSDYVKDNYYVVAKMDDGTFVRIPKGRAVAVIQNAFEQMKNVVTGEDELDIQRFGELLLNNLAPNNPIEDNILAPIIQVANNETWYGEDLVPTRLQDLPDAEQYDESTDSISRWLGENIGGSPYKWNYLLGQYTGGVGDVFLPMITPEAESGDNSFKGNMIAPWKDAFATDSVMNNQNVSDFYDTVDELTKNANSSGATDEDVLKYKYMNSINADLGELYQQKREIQNSDLDDAEKYEAVREIQAQIDALAKESLNTYNNVNIDGVYATVGDRHYRWYEPSEDSEAEAGWQKITDKQLEKQENVTGKLGISASEYWSNKEEYDYAYDHPENYAVAKSVGGYKSWKNYQSELYDIHADKDEDGKSISGSRKEKVIDYVNSLDIDYGMRIILFKSEYNADDTYNYDILEYLNSRDDLTYEERITILKELGFTISADGSTASW